MKKKAILGSIIILILTMGFFIYKQIYRTKPIKNQTQTNNTQDSSIRPEFDKTQYSLSEPTSIWIVVNKKRSIPTTYIPELTVPAVRLRLDQNEEQMKINTTTEPALKEMFESAQKDNITLVFGSGYRSAITQKSFYDDYKSKDGQTQADTYSARPGHSEHQTGFSADITSVDGKCHLEICWENTPEGKWLAENSYKFGFIIRYPKDKQSVTGYQYEPWHVRYVGKDLSAQIHKSNLTLEEFFGLGSAQNYD